MLLHLEHQRLVEQLRIEAQEQLAGVKTAEGAALAYTVKSGTTAIGAGDAILTVNPDSATDGSGASGSATLTFTLDDTIKYAGIYTGTVTFTVSVEKKEEMPPMTHIPGFDG